MRVLVIGGAGMDIKAYAATPLGQGASALGVSRQGYGGVGRNIAENLARLGAQVTLLTVLGDDLPGEQLRAFCQQAGINMQHVQILPQHRTGSYTALLNPSGELFCSVSDFAILDAGFTPAYIAAQEEQFAAAELLVLDANAPADTLALVFQLAQRHHLPTIVDPTLTPKALRLRPFLRACSVITPSMAEAAAISGLPVNSRSDAEAAARWFVGQGVGQVVITLGAQGALAASATGMQYLPAPAAVVQDVTGAGDALSAGISYGLLRGCPAQECLQLGMRLAALTVEVESSVHPQLQPAMLYDTYH